ncbi:MAG: DUF1659 domain-containing protein [Solibacillus sp.]
MNPFVFQSATVTVFYQAGVDELGEPVVKGTTYRNLVHTVTGTQIQTAAQALIGLTDFAYIESVKTQKELIGS